MENNNIPKPKISIITPSFNQGQYIETAIQSVLNQDYPNFEHIIIDGNSSDNTIEIIKGYDHLIWVSECDNGMSDALVKGLQLASGEVIGWLNSDDYYLENIFNDVADSFFDGSLWITGNLIYLNEQTKVRRKHIPKVITYNGLIENPDIVKQVSTFYRKSILYEAGWVNIEFKMAMDYDLFVRLSKIEPSKMINKYWGYYRNHENQKTSANNASVNLYTQIKEINFVLRREGINFFQRLYTIRKKIVTLLIIWFKNMFRKRVKY